MLCVCFHRVFMLKIDTMPELFFDFVALLFPFGIAVAEEHDLFVSHFLCRDRGLDAGHSADPPAVEDNGCILVFWQQSIETMEFFLRNIDCAWYTALFVLIFGAVIDYDGYCVTAYCFLEFIGLYDSYVRCYTGDSDGKEKDAEKQFYEFHDFL